MSAWTTNWTAVESAVKASETRGEAVAKVSAILEKSVTWDALQRSWSRQTGQSILLAMGGGEVVEDCSMESPDPAPVTAPPWYSPPVKVATKEGPLRILVIPDTQCMPGVPTNHFTALGRYTASKRPDVIVHLGDFRDMPSLSSYESAVRRAREGRCKVADIDAGNKAIELFENELAKAKGYSPVKVMLEGNHDGWNEHGRIGRYLAEHPDDQRLFELVPFLEKQCGWQVFPFLQTVEIAGVLYCHLFPYSAKGTVTGASLRMGAGSASAQVKAVMQSCTAGHKQGLDVAIYNTPVSTHRGLIAGSFYQHQDGYMPGARFWRGVLTKTEAQDGNYGLVEVSLDFLLRKYL